MVSELPNGGSAGGVVLREETGGGSSEKNQQEVYQMKLGGDRNRPDTRGGRAEFTDGHQVSPSSMRGVSFAACRAGVT